MESRAIFRIIKAVILLTILTVGGFGFGGENKAKADLSAGTATPVPTWSEEELDKKISQALEYYAIKQQEMVVYKEELNISGCQEINLDFCAGVLYAIEKSDGIKSPGVFDLWQETILGDYITKEQVFEFGRTGKGLDVIYFKDTKGKKTNEPALCYVFNPKVKRYKLNDIDRNINFWEKLAPGFLRALVANDVRVLFQSQASSDTRVGTYRYEFGMIYFNDSNEDGGGPDSANMPHGLAVEMFGVKGDAFEGGLSRDDTAIIKQWLTRDCAVYVAKRTGNKRVASLAETYQDILDRYLQKYWINVGKNIEEMKALIDKIKKDNLMTPFGAETWEEIDSANTLQTAEEAYKKAVDSQVFVTSIQIQGSSTAIPGQKIPLKATVYPSNATYKGIIWQSSDKSVASVDTNGVVTIKKDSAGKRVSIIAGSVDLSNIYGSCEISIYPPVSEVEISRRGDIKLGEKVPLIIDLASDNATIQLVAKVIPDQAKSSVNWKSSSSSVASVDDNGLVTGFKVGTVTITATAVDGSKVKASVKVNINVLAKQITISGNNTIKSGKQTALKAIVMPVEVVNKKVTWASSDETVATVSNKGVVTAKKVNEEKTVIIAATAEDGSGATVELLMTVTP